MDSCLLPPFDPQMTTRRTPSPSRAASPDSDKENDVRAARKTKRVNALGKTPIFSSPAQTAGLAILMRKEAGNAGSNPLKPRRLEYYQDWDVDVDMHAPSSILSSPLTPGARNSPRRMPFAELASPAPSDGLRRHPDLAGSSPASPLKSPYRRSPLSRTPRRVRILAGRPDGFDSASPLVAPFAALCDDEGGDENTPVDRDDVPSPGPHAYYALGARLQMHALNLSTLPDMRRDLA